MPSSAAEQGEGKGNGRGLWCGTGMATKERLKTTERTTRQQTARLPHPGRQVKHCLQRRGREVQARTPPGTEAPESSNKQMSTLRGGRAQARAPTRDARGGGDAGDDAHGHAAGLQILHLLAAAAKHIWITTLEPAVHELLEVGRREKPGEGAASERWRTGRGTGSWAADC